LQGPAFLTGQPAEITPLAKRDPKDPRKVQQFQILLAGSEMGNGYSELNDPHDQDERFKEQRALEEAGDSEAHPHDEAFVEALKHGMPPTCGFGFSERLFSLLENKPIRECVIFPLMKPLDKKKKGKKNDWRVFANTCSCIIG
jgi:lysyl-tRNA synthetase class 2